jgi:predicted thioesterase
MGRNGSLICPNKYDLMLRENQMDLHIGLVGEKEMIVTESDLASFAGNIGADVLSTHCVVLLIELAAREAIKGRIEEGKITLGTRVEIRHFAAAPIGSRVRAVARLTAMEGRKLFFQVAAYDDVDKLAKGENEQIIVSQDAFLKRVRGKTE